MRLIAVTALSLTLAAACAPSTPATDASGQPRACFFISQVDGFGEGPPGSNAIFIRSGVSDTFELQSLGGCPDIDWSLRIGLDPSYGTGSRCVGDTVGLLVPRSTGGVDRCLARVTRKLSDEEARERRGR